MTRKKLQPFFLFLTLFFCFACAAPTPVDAQRRDHLNESEVELVRDAQEIDLRTEIFIKAADRRFLVLNNDNTQAEQVQKDIDKWGELPTGTRLQILSDIRKILAEAIENIDDAAAHSKSDTPIFARAVHRLADAANRFMPALKGALAKTADEKETGAIIASIEYCEQIVEASAKVPKEEPKKKKTK